MKGASPMSTYITLIRFTQKGMEAIKERPARLDAAKQAFQALGAKIKDFYLVTGKYDAVAVAGAPDEETLVKLSLDIAEKGNSRTETLHADTDVQYGHIVPARPKVN